MSDDSPSDYAFMAFGFIIMLTGPALLVAHYMFGIGGLGVPLAGTLITAFFLGIMLVEYGFSEPRRKPPLGWTGIAVWGLGILLVGMFARNMTDPIRAHSTWADIWTFVMILGTMLAGVALAASLASLVTSSRKKRQHLRTPRTTALHGLTAAGRRQTGGSVPFSARPNPPQAKAQTEGSKPLRLGFRIYQQIAAVLGAIGLAAMLRYAVDLDWHGFISNLVGFWDVYIRAGVNSVLDILVVRPAQWLFHVKLEVPLYLRDYLAVTAVFALSMLRMARTEPIGKMSAAEAFRGAGLGLSPSEQIRWMSRFNRTRAAIGRSGRASIIVQLVIADLLWPIWLLLQLIVLIFSALLLAVYRRDSVRSSFYRRMLRAVLLALAPMLYLALLLAIDHFIL